jgi:uncharacterized phage protein (TIGR02218 family)
MTFNTYEIADGRPTELYAFQVGTVVTRVTSAAVDQVVGGQTYTTLAIQRTEPAQSSDVKSGEITLQVPSDFQLVLDFRSIIPYSLPTLTIYRFHQNDATSDLFTFWKGYVSSVAMQDTMAEIACQPIDRIFSRQIPRFVYSGICNHTLYDAGCRVVPTAFDHASTVSAIDSRLTTITITGLRAQAAAIAPGLTSAELDTFWQGGYLENATGSERRMILEGNVGGDPNAVRVLLPFREMTAGQSITAFAGCDHSVTTCNAKFGNVTRFGGYPYVPTQNPFSINLDGGV